MEAQGAHVSTGDGIREAGLRHQRHRTTSGQAVPRSVDARRTPPADLTVHGSVGKSPGSVLGEACDAHRAHPENADLTRRLRGATGGSARVRMASELQETDLFGVAPGFADRNSKDALASAADRYGPQMAGANLGADERRTHSDDGRQLTRAQWWTFGACQVFQRLNVSKMLQDLARPVLPGLRALQPDVAIRLVATDVGRRVIVSVAGVVRPGLCRENSLAHLTHATRRIGAKGLPPALDGVSAVFARGALDAIVDLFFEADLFLFLLFLGNRPLRIDEARAVRLGV